MNLSGAGAPSESEYEELVNLVAHPSKQLGLTLSLPPLSEYSTERVLTLKDEIEAELRKGGGDLRAIFAFVWGVFLLLSTHATPERLLRQPNRKS